MKTLTNCSALSKPSSCVSSNRTTSIINPMKSYLITEYKPQSKLQLSIQQQKEGINHHYHHHQRKTNIISFTSSTNNNNNVSSSSNNNKFHYKVYEHAIDALFTFLKETLHNDVYTTIKQVFCDEISKAYDLYYEYIYHITNSFMCYKHSSSIGKMLSKLNVNYTTCCGSGNNNKKNLKLSYNFYNELKHKMINNTKHVKGYSCNNTEKKQSKQYSLYTLTKNKKLFQNKVQSISQSKSNSQDNKKQSNFILNIKLYNKLNKTKRHKTDIYYTTTTTNSNNGNTNNTKVGNKKVKYTFNNTTIIPNVNSKLSRNNHSNCSLFYFQNNNNNMNSTSSQSNKHYIDNNFKGTQPNVTYKPKQKQNSNKQSTSHYNYKTFSHLHFPSESTYSVRKSIKLPNNNNNNHKNTNSNNVHTSTNINEKQTSEQLKEIKSNLDEHLKVMFNFSYEGFLNKESESVSKKSLFDVSTSPMENNNHSTLL